MTDCCFPFVPVLPAVYDRALSYEEQLCLLASRVEALKQAVDDFDLDGVKQVLDGFRSDMDAFQTTVNNQINAFENSVNTTNANFQSSINAQISAFLSKYSADIIALQDNIDKQAAAMNAGNKAYTDSEIAKVKDMIEQIEIDFNHIVVFNPYRGYRTTLQEWIDDNSQSVRFFAITAGEYDTLNLTATKYDNRLLTAYQYDFLFKHIFADIIGAIINPFTGLRDTVQNVIDWLASLHYSGYTAGVYDGFDMTAEAYDNKLITARAFNFSAWNNVTEG